MEETVRSIEVTLRRNMLKKKSTAITELKPISKHKKKWLVELDQVRESLTNRNTGLLPYQRLDLNNGNFSKELREYVHIPGSDRPFPLATSGLPSKHWDKCILERDHFDVMGKWTVFIIHRKTNEWFYSKSALKKYLQKRELPYKIEMFDLSLDNKLKKLWQVWKPIRDMKREQNCQNEDRISNFVKFHQFETKIDSLTQRYNNIMERHELNSMKNYEKDKTGKVSNIKKEI